MTTKDGTLLSFEVDPAESHAGLPRCVPGPDNLSRGLFRCDACFRSEIDDLLDGVGGDWNAELMPIYWDSAEELCLCAKCIDAEPSQAQLAP